MLFSLVLCALLVGLDQAFKALAAAYLAPVGSVTLIPGVLGLRYLENTGAAFNILRGQQMLLIILTSVALLIMALILLFRRPKGRLEYLALIFVLAGGVGNLIDRIAQRYVVDYIEFLFMEFAIFNFADILVCVGFALLVVGVFRSEHVARKQRELEEHDAAGTGSASEEKPTEKYRMISKDELLIQNNVNTTKEEDGKD